MDESAYIQGQQALARRLFDVLLPHLPGGADAEGWRQERADVALALKSLYRDATDEAPPWSDDLYLADVIEKYIAPLVIEG